MKLVAGTEDRWRLRVSAGRDEKGHRLVIERPYKGTEAGARKALARLWSEVDSGRLRANRCSLNQLCDRVVAHKEARGRGRRTVSEYARMARYLAETPDPQTGKPYGAIDVAKVSTVWLDRLLDRIRQEKGASSAAHYWRFLRTALRLAVTWDLIPRSPTDKMEGLREPEPEREPPSPEVVQRFIRAAQHGVDGYGPDEDFARAIFVAATTGLGPGELAGLQVRDVDFDRCQVSVRASVSRVDGEKAAGPTKTKARRAPVALDEATAEVLRRQIEEVASRRKAHKLRMNGTVWLWSISSDHDEPVAPDYFSGRWYRLRKALGEPPWRFYDLRHYGATQAIMAGVDVRTVQGRLRHSTSRLTLDRYAHVIEAQGRKAAEVIAATLLPGT